MHASSTRLLDAAGRPATRDRQPGERGARLEAPSPAPLVVLALAAAAAARAPARAHGAPPLGDGVSSARACRGRCRSRGCAVQLGDRARRPLVARRAPQGRPALCARSRPGALGRGDLAPRRPGRPGRARVAGRRRCGAPSQMFVVAVHARRGFDNGGSPRPRDGLPRRPRSTAIAADGPPAAASQANDLLGVLVVVGRRATADELRGRARSRRRSRAIPRTLDAKYNLELALRRARHVRPARARATARAPRGSGQRGAGAGHPGPGVLDVAGSVVLLSPVAGIAFLGAVLPVCCVVLAARRGRRVAEVARGLPPGTPRRPLAIACPRRCRDLRAPRARRSSAGRSDDPHRARVGTHRPRCSSSSTSPARCSASDGPAAPTRLERAQERRARLRGAVPDVPAGVAGLTDRSFPISSRLRRGDVRRTSSAVRSSIEAPPPQEVARNATSFDALAAARDATASSPRSAARRTCVLVTDGESRAVLDCGRGAALDGSTGCSLLVVRVGRPASASTAPAAKPEAAYRPDRGRADVGAAARQATGGAVLRRGRPGRAAARAPARRRASAPSDARCSSSDQRRLAPLLAAVALVACSSGSLPRHCDRLGASRAWRIPWFHESAGSNHVSGCGVVRLVVAALLGRCCARVASPAPRTAARSPRSDGDWAAFGRTADNNRHSPLTEITPANVAQLDRVYTIDFQKLDPDVRRGQQSYPLAIGGTLYVTTNDDNVFALDGATGKVHLAVQAAEQRALQELRHRREPRPRLLRRPALHLAARHEARRARAERRQGARARRDRPGRPERVRELRLLRDERADLREPPRDRRRRRLGVRHPRLRDGVHDRPEAGLAEPVLDDPARPAVVAARLARSSAAARSGRRSPSTRRRTRVYFGTGSATPLYFPSLRPGREPAHRLADRGRPDDREDEVVAAADRRQPVGVRRRRSRRSSTTARSAARRTDVVSVATMEGVWFAFDARPGKPFHERVKVIDRVEHPPLRPGQPVTVFPSSLGGLNYSPAVVRPGDELRLQRGSRDRRGARSSRS